MRRRASAVSALLSCIGARACATATTPAVTEEGPLNVEARRGEWSMAMQNKYGEGAFQLFRPLYRDLVDEMRIEGNAQPPPPIAGWTMEVLEDANLVVARKAANEHEKTGRVTAFTTVKMGNPPKLHQGLYIADFYPIEVLVERNGVVMHFSLCAIERQMHLRNVRMHTADALGADTDLLAIDANTLWARHHLLYDGPCLSHLEIDMHSELHETMMDHGIDLDIVLWVSDWASYAEHVAGTRWMLGMMDAVIPEGRRGGEEDFLTAEELEALDEPIDEFRGSRGE